MSSENQPQQPVPSKGIWEIARPWQRPVPDSWVARIFSVEGGFAMMCAGYATSMVVEAWSTHRVRKGVAINHGIDPSHLK